MEHLNRELFAFLDASPTCYHAINYMTGILTARGYRQLREFESWTLEDGVLTLKNGEVEERMTLGKGKLDFIDSVGNYYTPEWVE